jgi:hypothetical protein
MPAWGWRAPRASAYDRTLMHVRVEPAGPDHLAAVRAAYGDARSIQRERGGVEAAGAEAADTRRAPRP